MLDGNQGGTYQPERAYANSKLANLLFAFELQQKASLNDCALVSNAAHPGVSATNLVTSKQGLGAIPGVRPLAPAVLRLLFQSAAAGADPVLYAVAEGEPASYTGPQRLRAVTHMDVSRAQVERAIGVFRELCGGAARNARPAVARA